MDSWYHANKQRPGSINTRGGYFLSQDDSFRQFDASFFGINPKEAASIDPQQRKLLEVVYESFEAAGARLQDVSGSNTACYVGNFTWDIGQMQARDVNHGAPYHMTVRFSCFPTLCMIGSLIWMVLLTSITGWRSDDSEQSGQLCV